MCVQQADRLQPLDPAASTATAAEAGGTRNLQAGEEGATTGGGAPINSGRLSFESLPSLSSSEDMPATTISATTRLAESVSRYGCITQQEEINGRARLQSLFCFEWTIAYGFHAKIFSSGLKILGGETVGGRVQWPGKDNFFRRGIAPKYAGRAQPQ